MTGIEGDMVRLGLLVALVAACIGRARWPAAERQWHRILGLLVAIGLFAYIGFVRVHPDVGRIHIHHPDVYHYYVGTKYFAELGQAGLYEATVIADFEDDPARFRPEGTIRDLRDSAREIRRSEVLEHRESIRARFAPERWQEFKADVAYFRAAEPERWTTMIPRDHGYNGTPLTTWLLGTLANWSPGGIERFLAFAVWLDLVLVAATAGMIGALLGAEAGLLFAFFWLANPLNDYDFTGGSFLRYNYFIALALGIAFQRRGWGIASGVGLAASALFRIFPVVFPAALAACDLLHPQRRARWRRNRSLYAAALASAVSLGVATSFIPAPAGVNPWLRQLQVVSARNALQSPNGISLRFPFLYRAEHDLRAVWAAVEKGQTLDWLAETTRTFEQRRPYYALAAAGLLGLALFFARRTRGTDAFFVGLVALFATITISHYYYCLLALIPLMFDEDRRVTQTLGIGLAAIAIAGLVVGPVLDLRYAVVSALVGATLVAILCLRLRAANRRDAQRPASGTSARA